MGADSPASGRLPVAARVHCSCSPHVLPEGCGYPQGLPASLQVDVWAVQRCSMVAVASPWHRCTTLHACSVWRTWQRVSWARTCGTPDSCGRAAGLATRRRRVRAVLLGILWVVRSPCRMGAEQGQPQHAPRPLQNGAQGVWLHVALEHARGCRPQPLGAGARTAGAGRPRAAAVPLPGPSRGTPGHRGCGGAVSVWMPCGMCVVQKKY